MSPSKQDPFEALREAARSCTDCPLHANATQTVFGEGDRHALIMLVGEQPGDQEDRQGHPFVGPAGQLLDRALAQAGIDRNRVYVTNAVKHFKWEPRGKRRLHKKPNEAEVAACHQWLAGEIGAVQPRVIVCLGVTAAYAVLGRPVKIGAERGRLISAGDNRVLVTTHPSAVLRLRENDERERAFSALVRDLVQAREGL